MIDLSQKIDVVYDISPEDFHKNYFIPQKPLVIRRLSRFTFAGHHWSIDYFKNQMGDIMVDIFDNGNKKAAASAFTRADLKMRFADYLSIIEKNEHTDLRIFLFNLFKYNPSLRQEFPCPDFFKNPLDNFGFMFFGGKDTTVRLHYDIDMCNVLHTHFGGRKRVLLFAPEYSKHLYKLPLNTYSLVDLDKPDFNKYPALDLLKGSEVILNDGDAVFMPSGYWHYMTYLEGSFSVSYRKLPARISPVLKGIANLCLYMPIDKLMNRLAGSRWLRTKQQIAESRANTMFVQNFMENNADEVLGI